jgi:RNA polymerase subunit RPABC4/transcription elongation factor Spt4
MPTKNCPSCARSMNADLATCPWCGSPSVDATLLAPGSSPATDTVACPYCQEPVKRDAQRCRWCGENLAQAAGAGPGAQAPNPQPQPQPAGYYPPPPPPPPMYAAPPQAPPGTLPLVFGILGLVVCGFFGPVAWITGNSYENKCRAMGVEPDSAGKAGKVLGIVVTVLLLLAFCGVGFFAVLAGASGASR